MSTNWTDLHAAAVSGHRLQLRWHPHQPG